MHRTHRQDDRDRRGGVVVSSMCRMFAGFALTTLLGCGDNTTVAACFGDAVFCHLSFNPRANPGAGPDGGRRRHRHPRWIEQRAFGRHPVLFVDADGWSERGVGRCEQRTRIIRGAFRDQRRNPVVPAYRRESNESGRQRFDRSSRCSRRATAAVATALALFRGSLQPDSTGRIDERLSIGDIRIDGGRRDRATRRVVGGALPGDREGHRRGRPERISRRVARAWSPQMMGR